MPGERWRDRAFDCIESRRDEFDLFFCDFGMVYLSKQIRKKEHIEYNYAFLWSGVGSY